MPRLPTGHRVPAGLQQLLQKRRTGQQLGPWDYMEMADPGGIMGPIGAITTGPGASPYLLSLGYRFPRLHRILTGSRVPNVNIRAHYLGTSPGAYLPKVPEKFVPDLGSTAILLDPGLLKTIRKYGEPESIKGLPGRILAHESFHHIVYSSPRIRKAINRFLDNISDAQFKEVRTALERSGYDLSELNLEDVGHEFIAKAIDEPDKMKTLVQDQGLKDLISNIYKIATKR